MTHLAARISLPIQSISVAAVCMLAAGALAQTTPSTTPTPTKISNPQLEWSQAEAPILTHSVELTSRKDFIKAGEQYFSPDGNWMIFQGIPVPPAGQEPGTHYSMFIARLNRDAHGNITGIQTPTRVSPKGSANTCGWFNPVKPGQIMFASTLVPPKDQSGPGYKRLGGKYAWQFPSEMNIVTRFLPELAAQMVDAPAQYGTATRATPLFDRPGYDAEGSYSSNGRFLLYAHVDEQRSKALGRPDADIYIYDTKTHTQVPLVAKAGYDGGPFFSPDMSWICYRSDRRGDGNLQLFVAQLDYSKDGSIVGIKREVQLTDNEHVNWAPYFHPSGRFLVYTTSELGHHNYEVYAIEFDPEKPMNELWKFRVTHGPGFDGLPAFSRDGKDMIWCAQRGPVGNGDTHPSSQIWATHFDAQALLERVANKSTF